MRWLTDECDATVRAQWRRTGLGYAADVVEAWKARCEEAEAELARVRSDGVPPISALGAGCPKESLASPEQVAA